LKKLSVFREPPLKAVSHSPNSKGICQNDMECKEKAVLAAQLAEEKKAVEVAVLDLRGVCGFTDFFVVCSGQSPLQLRAVADCIEQGLKKAGVVPIAVEGKGQANWIVLDFGDVLVHVMSETARAYYALERLWGDAKVLDVLQPASPGRTPAQKTGVS
jgi:ribosome-associated protein